MHHFLHFVTFFTFGPVFTTLLKNMLNLWSNLVYYIGKMSNVNQDEPARKIVS